MLNDRAEALLARIEAYLKTDLRYIIQGGFWLTASSLFSLVASLATSIAFANFLTPADYGIYRYVLSVAVLLTIPTLSGMDTALTRAVAKGREGSFRDALWTKIRWGLLGGLASLIVAGYYWWQGDWTLTWSFLIAALFMPIMDPFNLYTAYLDGRREFKKHTRYEIAIRTVASLALIGIAFILPTALAVVAVYFIVYTLLRFISLRLTLAQVPKNTASDPGALSFGKHLSLISVLGVVSTSLDKILIFHYLGAATLAGYYLSMVPYKQVLEFMSSIPTLALPKFSNYDLTTLKTTLPGKIAKFYLIIVPIILVYVIAASFVFNLIYPKYLEFISLSQVMMIQLIFYPISILYTALVAHAAKKRLYFYTISSSLFRIGAFALLIPLYGSFGAAAAMLATGLFGYIVLAVAFYRF